MSNPKTLDDLFNELPPVPPPTVEEEARHRDKSRRETERYIRRGWLNSDGTAPDASDEDDETVDEETHDEEGNE